MGIVSYFSYVGISLCMEDVMTMLRDDEIHKNWRNSRKDIDEYVWDIKKICDFNFAVELDGGDDIYYILYTSRSYGSHIHEFADRDIDLDECERLKTFASKYVKDVKVSLICGISHPS